jgi:hypothetical protein
VFTDRKGRRIGDVEITGVDGHEAMDDDPYTPLDTLVEDFEQYEHMEEVDPDITPPDTLNEDTAIIEDERIPEPEPARIIPDVATDTQVEVETVHETDDDVEHIHQEQLPATPSEPDPEIPGVQRSTRTRSQTQTYTPSMTGKKYEYIATQMEKDGVLHPGACMLFQTDMYQAEPDVVAAIMTQLLMKAGLKEWGTRAMDAVHSEMKQLHLRDTFKPKHWKDLTPEQKASVLESHLFLKEKRSGTIKGRTVAGGNKQRDFISKEDASSPTVATESVLLTCIVDAEEERDVAVIDIPNAFIKTRVQDEKDMVIIKIRGILVDTLVSIAPDVYKPYVTTDKKGEKQLIVQCLNAIY